MAITTALAIYFLLWWMCLFVVLPFGVKSQIEEGNIQPGTDPGAPVTPYIWRKLLANTVLAGVVFGLYWVATVKFGYSISDIPSPYPQD